MPEIDDKQILFSDFCEGSGNIENDMESMNEDKIPSESSRPYLYDVLAFDKVSSDAALQDKNRKGRYTVAAKPLGNRSNSKNSLISTAKKSCVSKKNKLQIEKKTLRSKISCEISTKYYKNGNLCYAGCVMNEKRCGPGVIFDTQSKELTVSSWEDDKNTGKFSQLNDKGEVVFTGKLEGSRRKGINLSYADNGHIFVSAYKGDECTIASEFDNEGNLVYSGGVQDNVRNGVGVEFNLNSEIIYSGNFENGLYNGEGILYRTDGSIVQGNFKNGEVFGFAVEFNECGDKIYEGNFKNGKYDGIGCKFTKGGLNFKGTFEAGKSVGMFEVCNGASEIIYKGEVKNDRYEGKGTYYVNGKKVYEGEFKNNCYNGYGKEYQDDIYRYEGEFLNNKRNGFGISYKEDKMLYKGHWKDDQYDGCGILYSNGQAKFAGEFKNGKMNGRINKMNNGQVVDECIYCNNKVTYMRKFELDEDNNLSIVYEGYIEHNLPNGSGCKFDLYGEKEKEGFFRDGDFEYPLQISKKKNLKSLPEVDYLENTEYCDFIKGADYLVEKDFKNFIYSGMVKNNSPEGKGTLAFPKYKFKGQFKDGKPFGKGMIIQDGKVVVKGNFTPIHTENCKVIDMYGVSYFYK